jgi:predicted metal-binding protein
VIADVRTRREGADEPGFGERLRALRQREGAFSIYRDCEVELVGFPGCGGCPGGNIEHAPAETIKNGAEVIHLATGMVVGYPPCPRLGTGNSDRWRQMIAASLSDEKTRIAYD